MGHWKRAIGLLACLAGTSLQAQVPTGTTHSPLASQIAAMAEGSWARVNNNNFSAAWPPLELRTLMAPGFSPTYRIIDNWSSFGWDTRRGDLIMYGGGHQSYTGNDVYRWRSSTLQWERASLPSEVQQLLGGPAYIAIDGADAAPASTHTYDNNLYLPVVDRFMAWGGAAWNTGTTYMRLDETDPTKLRQTGPYLFDPSRSDPDQVGGTTGSHVQRVAPHPEIVGGNMWQNRDHVKTIRSVNLSHVDGCTGYATEGGLDVVYMGARIGGSSALSLFRYELDDVAVPASDRLTQVGTYWTGPTVQTTCAYDPANKLFVRTGVSGKPFVFWDLTFPSPTNRDQAVDNTGSIAAFDAWLTANGKSVTNCGLDFDPVAGQHAVWCGGGSVWMLQSPPGNGKSGWTITQVAATGVVVPPEASSDGYTFTGVLGKWKYIPGYDVYAALENGINGNVWIYKPFGWTASTGIADAPPSVALTSPNAATTIVKGSPITLEAEASDADGSVTKVEFFANGSRIGAVTSAPYSFTWTPAAGTYWMMVRANDDRGGVATSPAVSLSVDNPPTVTLTAPASGSMFSTADTFTVSANAVDTDGAVAAVRFYANQSLIATLTSAPYSFGWKAPSTGSYDLTAAATDNDGATTTSDAVTVSVAVPNAPPMARITSPSNGDGATVGAALNVTADASDPDGSVSQVQFFVNGSSLGIDTGAPYSTSWVPAAAGIYSLTVVATDNLGAKTTSAAVSIIASDAPPGGTVTVLQRGLNGYAGSADTMLTASVPTATGGKNTKLLQYYQSYVALFRFAIFAGEGGPVPDGATIIAAKMEVTYNACNYTYRLHAMRKAWSEAEANWLNAQAGSAWTVGGANGSGTDYESTADAQVTVPGTGGWMSFDVTSRVQAMAAGGANFGWRIVGVSGTECLRQLTSSEYSTSTQRPKLTVTYTTP